MTGAELKAIRRQIGEAIGDRLSYLDMAALCGLTDPAGNGRDTYRKWEDGGGPSGPVALYLRLLVDGLSLDNDSATFAFLLAHVREIVGIVPL